MGGALKDLASGRPRPFPRYRGDLRDGLIAWGVLIVAGASYGVWHERHEGPRHRGNVMAALHAAGFAHAELRRDWISGCGRGRKGFTWQSGTASGTACSYGDAPRASVRVDAR